MSNELNLFGGRKSSLVRPFYVYSIISLILILEWTLTQIWSKIKILVELLFKIQISVLHIRIFSISCSALKICSRWVWILGKQNWKFEQAFLSIFIKIKKNPCNLGYVSKIPYQYFFNSYQPDFLWINSK